MRRECNVLVSPYAVATALALLAQASSGTTFEQIQQGLRIDTDKISTAQKISEQRESIEKSVGNATLSIVIQIYVKQVHKLKDHFQNVANLQFSTGIQPLNFEDPVKSSQLINNHIKKYTYGKIEEIIESNQLKLDTSAVLVNAFYFKGRWEREFDIGRTRKDEFFITEYDKVLTDFMYRHDCLHLLYSAELRSMTLELKYANSTFSLVIILPNIEVDLDIVEERLKHYDWSKFPDRRMSSTMDLHIPKFKVECETKFNDVLKSVSISEHYIVIACDFRHMNSNQFNIDINVFFIIQMGMTEIFSDTADLSGMCDSGPPVKISDTIQKVIVEIDEYGNEIPEGGTY